MIRRKQGSKDTAEADAHVPVTIPLGDGHTIGTTTQPRRRRKKKTQGFVRSCLVRLRIVSPPRKTIESGLAASRAKGGDGCTCCSLLSGFVVFLLLCLGAYYVLLEGQKSKNLIIRSTNNFPEELVSEISEIRLSKEEHDALPLLLGRNSQEDPNQKDDDDSTGREFQYPKDLGHKEQKEMAYVDFGSIDLKLLANDDQKRQIYIMVEDLQGEARSLNEERDDDYENYYWGFDDDIERNPYTLYSNYNPSMEGRCRRVSWHRYNFPTCNSLHELDLITNTPRFVGDGAYREVFVTEQLYMGTIEETIFKELRWDLDYEADSYEYVRMDAFVTERFTSHKQFVDIFGFCGVSMLTEYFPFGDVEKDVVGFQHHRKDFNPLKDEVLNPLNNFTGTEKLQLALNMVEPVAALHNFKDGVVVHDDIQLCQYLWTEENGISVKLNDFNRAEIMLWDDQAQKYCKYKNGRGHGDWRSPEEYKDLPLDEKIDIWSLGNNFYSILTGVYPFFNVEKDRNIQQMIKDGKTAVIDPRYVDSSFAEGKLVEVIFRCFEYDPELRADINEIWQMLKDAIAENELWEKEAAKKKAEAEQKEKEEAERAEGERLRKEEEEAQKRAEAERLREEEEVAQKRAEADNLQQEAEEALRRAKEQKEKDEALKRASAPRKEQEEVEKPKVQLDEEKVEEGTAQKKDKEPEVEHPNHDKAKGNEQKQASKDQMAGAQESQPKESSQKDEV
ncbi:Probable serine/threonine-protein kinase [Seminavis robusta]|uniref:non-specific serine/threonine protein kinase n=1 Tax=Seminavis robusta TaxID=568900 RepID=A0A9N8H4H8_9STRA|nr:Probable serine/threonine-protein kinase [Seminavis robusta]|eukprot:Sro84_g045090.1 Probable serine/threonine-protein kinase (730) ;mRNA; f:123980-126888